MDGGAMWMTVKELRDELSRWSGSDLVVVNTPDRLFERYKLKRVEVGAVDVEDHRTGGGDVVTRRHGALVLEADETVGGRDV
jgi:hypothetical protein